MTTKATRSPKDVQREWKSGMMPARPSLPVPKLTTPGLGATRHQLRTPRTSTTKKAR